MLYWIASCQKASWYNNCWYYHLILCCLQHSSHGDIELLFYRTFICFCMQCNCFYLVVDLLLVCSIEICLHWHWHWHCIILLIGYSVFCAHIKNIICQQLLTSFVLTAGRVKGSILSIMPLEQEAWLKVSKELNHMTLLSKYY